MWVFLDEAWGKADSIHPLGNPLGEFAFGDGLMGKEGFCQGVIDGHPRVEGSIGVLEDHLEILPCLAQGRSLEVRQAAAVETYASLSGFDELKDGSPQSGFAASRLSDQSKNFSALQIQIDAVDGLDGGYGFAHQNTFFDRKMCLQTADFQEGINGRAHGVKVIS